MMSHHAAAFAPSLPLQPATSRRLTDRHTRSPRCHPPRRPLHPTARLRRGFKPDPHIPESLFDVDPIKDVDFVPFDFSTLTGKVVFVSNVASDDGDTKSNYALMADLLERYHAAGLEVLAFPSNWYGQKETRPHPEIKAFVHDNFSDKIRVMSKTDIENSQVFALGCKYFPGEIIWNFHGKFLFNRNGIPVQRFDLLSTPEVIEAEVRRQLEGGYDSAPPPDEIPLEQLA